MQRYVVTIDLFTVTICVMIFAFVIRITWLLATRRAVRFGTAQRGKADAPVASPAPESSLKGVAKENDGETATVDASRSFRASAPARMLLVDEARSVQQRVPPPPAETWPQRPLHIVSEADYAKCEVRGEARFNSEEPFAFETPIFSGICLCRFRNLEPAPEASAERGERLKAYFHKKKRTFQVIIQGQFKRELQMDTVVTGHEFSAPLVNIPGALFLKAILRVLKRMSSSIDVQIFGLRPYVYASLCGTAQAMSVDAKGEEPDITCIEGVPENCTRLGGAFANRRRAVSVKKRKKMLSSSKIARNFIFNTTDVYTFDCFQHVFVPHTYELNLGFRCIDLTQHLNNQPAQIMAKTSASNEYLYCFSLWHEKLTSNAATKKWK